MTKKNTQLTCKVTIIGGGLTGLTLACALAARNISTVVIETNDPATITNAKSDGRCSAIAYGSYKIFDAIGVWDAMRDFAGPILDIRVSDNDSSLFLHYDHALVGNEPMGYMVENHVMLKALYQKAQTLDMLTILAPAHYRTIERDAHKVTVTLEDGGIITSELLCAADGKHSRIREAANIQTAQHNYHQTGIVCTIAHEHNHNGVAQERFLATGPFAVLPMQGGHHSSLVWTEHTDLAPLYLAMNDEDFIEQIQQRVGGHLGKITIAGNRFSYPLTLVHANRYTDRRLALVGDSAHGIHPLAGQGFNIGIRDVEKLTNILTEQQKLGADLGNEHALTHYDTLRKFDSTSLIAITTGLNTLFASQLLPIKIARRLGMAAVNKAPALKKFFMHHAMGNSGQ